MRALSLWQPWASLMAAGAKHIETRSWYCHHRGPLVICATKAWNRQVLEQLCAAAKAPPGEYPEWQVMLDRLVDAGYGTLGELPLGAALCRVDVIDCKPTERLLRCGIDRDERAFGDYGPGRYGIVTVLEQVFDPPIPCRGARGLWEWKGTHHE